jgi:oligopeptide/dipeptide ABC transporter ATP-binding protein
MYAGQIVETARADEIYADPGHPYSWGLIGSTPRLDVVVPKLVSIGGSPPDLIDPPVGCAFTSRCQLAIERCASEPPDLIEHLPDRKVACFRAFDVRTVDSSVTGPVG